MHLDLNLKHMEVNVGVNAHRMHCSQYAAGSSRPYLEGKAAATTSSAKETLKPTNAY